MNKNKCTGLLFIIVSLISCTNGVSIIDSDIEITNDKTFPSVTLNDLVASIADLIHQKERKFNYMNKNLLRTLIDTYDDREINKKSWKLPIKTIGWYAEKSSKSNTPQKMVSELTNLLDSYKIG